MCKILSKTIFLIFVTLFFTQSAFTEVKNIGIPNVRNYDNSSLMAGSQTWMIDASMSGLAYFANNDGVLEFDGINWREFPLPTGMVVRSVKTTNDGRIYAGGFDMFGYFFPDDAGKLVFHSLRNLLPENKKDFDEIWKIYDLPQGIIFQSFEQLMIYKDEKITIIDAPESFHFSFLVNGELYINDKSEGLYRLANDHIVKVPGTEFLKGQLIWAMLPKGDHILMATADNGIYEFDGSRLIEWKNPASEMLMEKQVYCAIPLNETTYAFGTIQDGVIFCDTAGRISLHINQASGLQNNTVLSMQTDLFGNLWLGLDNGIDYIEINSPLTYFSHFNGLSAGYSAVLHQGILYLGTNRGVFYYEWDKLHDGGNDQEFKLIPNTQGQVWDLRVVDGTLFCGHNSGIFIIENNKAELISNIQGGWTFISPQGHDDILICGTYTWLVKFEKKNGKWQEGIKIKGFKESSRYLVNGEGNSLWMSHGYKGVYHIRFDQQFDSVTGVDFYNNKNGFPSDWNIIVFELFGRPIFTTGSGYYTFDAKSDSIIPDEQLNALFERPDINILKEDSKGNLWYFTENDAGVYRLQEDGNYTPVDRPFRELKSKFIKGFQFVYPLDESHVLFGIQNGFAHYKPDYPKSYQQPYKAFIRNVKLSDNDSIIYWGEPPGKDYFAEIHFNQNQLQFEYSANDFENPQSLKFSTFMEGFDEDWTAWQNRSYRDFTNLRHGTYTFRVKAMNIFDVESAEASVTFRVNPPWYLSWWSYIFYAMFFVFVVFLFIKYIRYRMEKSKRQEEERQKRLFRDREKQLQTEALKAEKEVIRLRNEKLRAEMLLKDKELANNTMQMIQNSKSLIAIKNQLQKLAREIGDEIITNHINSMIRKLNRDIDTEKQWEVFENHFENVHEEFLKRLKANYPDLTPREMKLCAYLRLNISSKEISSLMNISTRGVEISRYRLRKKLDLDRETNLTDFIMTF